jgi:hypothetical protein
VDLARALGRRIPQLFLLGIEAGTVAAGAPRSAAVEQAVALVLERLPLLKSLLLSPGGTEFGAPVTQVISEP